jgi:hypothetical protein
MYQRQCDSQDAFSLTPHRLPARVAMDNTSLDKSPFAAYSSFSHCQRQLNFRCPRPFIIIRLADIFCIVPIIIQFDVKRGLNTTTCTRVCRATSDRSFVEFKHVFKPTLILQAHSSIQWILIQRRREVEGEVVGGELDLEANEGMDGAADPTAVAL